MAQVFLPPALMPAGTEMRAGPDFSLHVQMMVDDSGSIDRAGLTAAVITGHNGLLEQLQSPPPLADSGEPPVVLDPAEAAVVVPQPVRPPTFVRTTLLNGGQLSDSFLPPEQAVRLNVHNYSPDGYTPLFNRALEVLLAAEVVAAETTGARTVTCLMTDGEDNTSQHNPGDVKVVVERMLASGRHVVFGLGVGDQAVFTEVFKAMGIPEQCILVVAATQQGVQHGMGTVGGATSSIVDPGTFTYTAATGFGGTVQPPAAAGPRSAASPPAMPLSNTPGGWRPADFSLRWTRSGWQESEAWQTSWNATDCICVVDAPTPGTWLIIGRGRPSDWDQATRDALTEVTNDFQAQGFSGEVVFVPLQEWGQARRISRVHALIVPNPDDTTFMVTALRGNVGVQTPDFFAKLHAHQGNHAAVSTGKDILLASADRTRGRPAIVIRLG